MRKNLFTGICLIIFLGVSDVACKKIENTKKIQTQKLIDRFFELPENANPLLKRITDKIKEQNNTSNFLEDFIKREGFIHWDMAEIITKHNRRNISARGTEVGEDTIVLLPAVPGMEQIVKSFLVVKLNSEIEFKLYKDKFYAENGFDKNPEREKPNANDVVQKIMEFEIKIFGWDIYKVADKRLFSFRPLGVEDPEIFFVKMKEEPEDGECVEWAETVSSDGGVTWEDTGVSWWDGFCDDEPTSGGGGGWGYGTQPGSGWGQGGGIATGGGNNGNTSSGETPTDCLSWYRLAEVGNGYNPNTPTPCTPVSNPVPTYQDDAMPPFIWIFSVDDGTSFIDTDLPSEPNFKFDLADNYESLYPRFTSMVKNLKTFVKNNPKVLAALQKYSGFTKQEIIEKLTFGNGPLIKIEEMYGRFGFYNKNNGINTLHIRGSYVRGLENSFLESTQEATAFLLAVTILHEFVHLGTSQNNISEGVYDFGSGFERDVFNVIVSDDNAGTVVIKFSKYF